MQPEILRFKICDAIVVAGEDRFQDIDIRVPVEGGLCHPPTLAKALAAYYAKYADASSALELKMMTGTAGAHPREGKGQVNGSPINLVQPEILRFKSHEAILVAGKDRFQDIDVRIHV